MSDGPRRVPLARRDPLTAEEALRRAAGYAAEMAGRRTVRDFADRPVDRRILEAALAAANSAPSGANMQPWRFVVIGRGAVRRRIREAAEAEEKAFYEGRASPEWLAALAPLGLDWRKPFLETAPWLVAVFAEPYHFDAAGRKVKHYYAAESVGIAVGLMISALHLAGLATLTHTPSPMGFLNEICSRPRHEKPFVLLVVGHPAEDATVPDIAKKPLDSVTTFL